MNLNHNHGRFEVIFGAWCPGCALERGLEREAWIRWAERMSAQLRGDPEYAVACDRWNEYVAASRRDIIDGTLG